MPGDVSELRTKSGAPSTTSASSAKVWLLELLAWQTPIDLHGILEHKASAAYAASLAEAYRRGYPRLQVIVRGRRAYQHNQPCKQGPGPMTSKVDAPQQGPLRLTAGSGSDATQGCDMQQLDRRKTDAPGGGMHEDSEQAWRMQLAQHPTGHGCILLGLRCHSAAHTTACCMP